MQSRRQHLRAPILTQVEAEAPHLVSLGRASNVSVGGLLVETRETLRAGAEVIVRFFIPPEPRPIEAAGRVVRSEPGKSMAIAFLGLAESDKRRIVEYVQAGAAEKPAADLSAFSLTHPVRRRGGRVARRIAVVLNWQDADGKPHQQAAQTKVLSQFGTLLTAYAPIEPGRVLRVSVPESGNEARSRVVYTTAAELPGRTEIAIEFVGTKNFWNITFPTDAATLLPTRRRSARLQRSLPVQLSWEAAAGARCYEAAETHDLSQHGARITASTAPGAGRLVLFRVPQSGRESPAHIVWAAPPDADGRVQLGIEFLGTQNFWGMTFPADHDYAQPANYPNATPPAFGNAAA